MQIYGKSTTMSAAPDGTAATGGRERCSGPVDPADDPGEARVHHARPARPDRDRAPARRAARRGGARRPEARADRGLHELRPARLRGREGTVEITYELYADRLVVEVADEGEGFEPPPGASARLDDDELSEGGLGIAIIEALADELEITRARGGGSSLRFVKHLA